MRIKISGNIVENDNPNKTNYNHEIYSMILTNISTERAKRIHEKKRFKRLFTFSDVYINKDKLHLYISGHDELIKDFINNIMFNQMVRIGDKVVVITSIEPLENQLKEKECYIFKTKFIVNEKENDKVCLSKDEEYIKKRISDIIRDKYNEMNNSSINDNLNVKIIKVRHTYTKYKDHHLNSYKAMLQISGNKDLINLMYNLGVGENTASGHGFVWEVA